MTDTLTSEQRVLRGREAERMLAEGSVLNQAIEAVTKEQTTRAISGRELQEREDARAIVLGLGAIAHKLAAYASDGQVEQANAEKPAP